jgi:3-phosphoshikimate 1-carboxyvinyltransferase
MHERPIGDLVEALRALGADIRYLGKDGFPPLAVRPARFAPEPAVAVRGELSSQFLTALLMALPLAGRRVAVDVTGDLVSKPYVELTLNSMQRFGVAVEREGWRRFVVPAGAHYRSPGTIHVEGDASSASISPPARSAAVRCACRASGGRACRGTCAQPRCRGDGRERHDRRRLIEVRGGARCARSTDLNHIPDAAMTVAVLALSADGPPSATSPTGGSRDRSPRGGDRAAQGRCGR